LDEYVFRNIILIYYSTMENLHFKIQIEAPVSKVYRTMLGLEIKKLMRLGLPYLILLQALKDHGKKEAKFILLVLMKMEKKVG
jgi:hypothetical protein